MKIYVKNQTDRIETKDNYKPMANKSGDEVSVSQPVKFECDKNYVFVNGELKTKSKSFTCTLNHNQKGATFPGLGHDSCKGLYCIILIFVHY